MSFLVQSRRFFSVAAGYSEKLRETFAKRSDAINVGGEVGVQFVRSRQEIDRIVGDLRGQAIVFGAGGCNDIPLIKLCDRFDRVCLVDIELKYTKKAIEGLPKGAQEKCILEKRDLIGGLGELSYELEKFCLTKPSFGQFVSKIYDLVSRLKETPFDYPDLKPSFVSSAFVNTQLVAQVVEYLEQVAQQQFGRSFVPYPISSLDDPFLQIMMRHVKELHRLAGKRGSVYFVDYMAIEWRKNGEVVSVGKFPGMDKVEVYIKENFLVKNREDWSYLDAKGLYESRLIRVSSFLLQSRE